jgi:hypothetical protein
MSTRTFARVWGILFLIIGAAGFVPGLTMMDHDHPDVTMDAGLGLELGLFPVNILHNVVHLLFGVWGLLAARSLGAARGYARSVAVIYAVFAVMGLISAARLWTTFGLVPLYGHDVWLHALLAAVAAYFGFFRSERATNEDAS